MKSEIRSDPLVEINMRVFPLADEQTTDSFFTLLKVFHKTFLYSKQKLSITRCHEKSGQLKLIRKALD